MSSNPNSETPQGKTPTPPETVAEAPSQGAGAPGAPLSNGMRFENMDPRALRANPRNWRKHGTKQRQAFSDFLDEVGWLDAVILNKRTGNLIDGHLRVEEALERNETTIPVLIVDIPEDKELDALYFKDRIGAMNDVDRAIEHELGTLITPESDLLQNLVGVEPTDFAGEEASKNRGKNDNLGIGLNPGEGYNYVMLLFKSDVDWYAAIEHFKIVTIQDPLRPAKFGLSRVIDGGAYLNSVLKKDSGKGTSAAPATPNEMGHIVPVNPEG